MKDHKERMTHWELQSFSYSTSQTILLFNWQGLTYPRNSPQHWFTHVGEKVDLVAIVMMDEHANKISNLLGQQPKRWKCLVICITLISQFLSWLWKQTGHNSICYHAGHVSSHDIPESIFTKVIHGDWKWDHLVGLLLHKLANVVWYSTSWFLD